MAWYHTQMPNSAGVDWSCIDTVLLDMDGTLLDLRFDNWFWLSLVPQHYAEQHGMSEAQAHGLLGPKFADVAHTLPWYCIDYWTRELGLDIRGLTRAYLDRVVFLPGADDFLHRLRASGKRMLLVTNSHPELLLMKDEKVGIRRFFDACYSTHVFDAPKEDPAFWPRLLEQENFALERALFVDDSMPVLKSAQAFGIGHIRAIRRPESDKPARLTGEFAAVDAVAELF
jgi:GMP/IMP 5'-nucleotidase